MSAVQTSLLSNTIKQLYLEHTRNAGTSPAESLRPGASEASRALWQGKNNKTGNDYNVNRALLQGHKLLNKNILGNKKA